MINQELMMERLSEMPGGMYMALAAIVVLVILVMLDIAGVIDMNKWGSEE